VVLQLLVTFSLGNLKRLKNGSITNIKNENRKLPDWFGKEYADEKEIDTETNDALQKRLENLKNKRPENK
jgi:hypothetical protein